MAEIGWIDFSKSDRKKVQQIMLLIKPEGQLDELGVGYLRDAVANQIFPGISTIQTRAKYFFIVPYILRDYLRLTPADRKRTLPRRFLIDEEHKIKNKLREIYKEKEGLGIIGITLTPGRYMVRNASEIYWNGLQVFRCLDANGLSLEGYLRNASRHHIIERSAKNDEADDADSNYEDIFQIKVPVNNNWRDELSIDLQKTEADYFLSQITNLSNIKLHDTLLPELFTNRKLLELFLNAANFQDFVLQSLNISYSIEVKQKLIMAFNFAIVMEGVHLLFNHLLQLHFFAADYDNSFEDEWLEWRKNLIKKMIEPESFNLDMVFNLTKRRRVNTELFVKRWWKMVLQLTPGGKPTAEMLNLVKEREKFAKPTKSRLSKTPTANEDVVLGKRIGLTLFQYRYFNARTIANDINLGLQL